MSTGEIDEDFIDLICREIGFRRDKDSLENVETIYFGGGTPSLCSAAQIDKILNIISSNFIINSDAEITLEANPLDLNFEKCRGFLESGINRISIGGQSAKNEMLTIMGRYHNHDQTELAVNSAREAGFKNISIDLIYGVPTQTIEELEKDLLEFTSFNTDHFSCYQLTVSNNHPWKRVLPGVDKLNKFDFYIQEYLECFGFERYEVSNYSKKGKRSRHNSIYWSWKPYLGIGPGAHGFSPIVKPFGSRYRNIGSLKSWSDLIISGVIPSHEPHSLTREEAILEYLITHLRCLNGFSLESFGSYFESEFQEITDKEVFRKALEGNLITLLDVRVTPTKKGLLVSEEIAWKLCKNNKLDTIEAP